MNRATIHKVFANHVPTRRELPAGASPRAAEALRDSDHVKRGQILRSLEQGASDLRAHVTELEERMLLDRLLDALERG